MPRRGESVARQSPTPTTGAEGSDLRSIANKIEGLLDDDGHYNPNPEQLSRGHPDYDESQDPRTKQETGDEVDRDERGRFRKKAAQAPEPGDDDDTDDADLAAGDDQPAAGDDQQDDTDVGDTSEDQAASADDAEQDDTDTGAINTLAELADALEMPIEDLQANLTHSFRAAGEDVTVNLGELVAGYQKDADYRRQTSELAEQRRQAEQDYDNRMRQFEQQHVLTAGMMTSMEQMLQNEFNSDDLAKLRQTDPAEWSARREEIGQRWNQLQQARNNAAQQYDTFYTQQQKELREREVKSLIERMPDFGDEHKQTARKAMGSLGYNDQEISNIFDHRLVLGALELASLRQEVEQLRAEKANAKQAVKRVKKTIPKLQKPGRGKIKGRGAITRDNVEKLRRRAAKTGTVEDAAKVIETMFQ